MSNILNNDQIRSRNRLAVLDLLCGGEALSRSDLTSLLGCDGTTVTNIIRSLSAAGLVRSLGCRNAPGRGRPKELIALNDDSCRAVGISLSPRMLCGLVTNFSGRIVYREQVHLEKSIARATLESRLRELIGSLLRQCTPYRLAGIGLGTFGVYLPERGMIVRAEYFDAVCGIHFEQFFQDEYGIRPEILDGTTCLGLSESWARRACLPSSFVLLNADVGIGCYIHVNSQALITRKGSYNEFGHTIMKADGGELCEAGHRGCLETCAAIPALERKATRHLKRTVHIDEILSLYQQGNNGIRQLVHDSAKWLGIATANLINLFAPEKVILSGKIAGFAAPYLQVLREASEKHAMAEFVEKTQFELSATAGEGPAFGAALAQLNKFRNLNLDRSFTKGTSQPGNKGLKKIET
jgi:N-acetylglucosamine repressor